MADDEQDNALDPTDPYERQAQTFPKLTREQIERVGRFGETGDYPEGTQLFRRGAGPAGLAAAVYGASEGLDTLVIEPLASGVRFDLRRSGSKS